MTDYKFELSWGRLIDALPDNSGDTEYILELKEKLKKIENSKTRDDFNLALQNFTTNDRNYLNSPLLDSIYKHGSEYYSIALDRKDYPTFDFLLKFVSPWNFDYITRRLCLQGNLEAIKYIVDKKYFRIPDNIPEYMLNACQYGKNLDLIKYLITQGAYWNLRSCYQRAIMGGNLEIVKFFESTKIDSLDSKWDSIQPGHSFIHDNSIHFYIYEVPFTTEFTVAVYSKNVELAKYYEKTRHKNDDEAMKIAAAHSTVEMVQYLITLGYKVTRDILQRAVKYNFDKKVIQFLSEQLAD